jgi:hypothetical protein
VRELNECGDREPIRLDWFWDAMDAEFGAERVREAERRVMMGGRAA